MKATTIFAVAMITAVSGWAQVSDATPPPIPEQPHPSFRTVPQRMVATIDPLTGQVIPVEPEPKRFSVHFSGGTPKELAEHLTQQAGSWVNMMVAPSMREAMLPAFELQNVTLQDVFQALNTVAGESIGGNWQLSGSRETIWVLNPIFQNQFMADISVPQQPPQKRTVSVLHVGSYLETFSIDDITTSIQTAWGMLGKESPGELKFHKDTNLLIAVGSDEQLKIVQDVIVALSNEMKAKDSGQAANENARLRQELEIMLADKKALNVTVESLKGENDRLKSISQYYSEQLKRVGAKIDHPAEAPKVEKR